ncbi:MAG: hypothetical protein ABI432_18740 [Flavobacteriales bacterium]
MWPVQTLTLLLSLTDEEQLFAQNQPKLEEIQAIEAPAIVVPVIKDTDLVLDLTC